MPKRPNVAGYVYAGHWHAAFDMVIGKLPFDCRTQLLPMDLICYVVVRVGLSPDQYVYQSGALIDRPGIIMRTMLPGLKNYVYLQMTRLAKKRGWFEVIGDPRSNCYTFVLTDEVRSVVKDVNAYLGQLHCPVPGRGGAQQHGTEPAAHDGQPRPYKLSLCQDQCCTAE